MWNYVELNVRKYAKTKKNTYTVCICVIYTLKSMVLLVP